jgi:hypothetical protein
MKRYMGHILWSLLALLPLTAAGVEGVWPGFLENNPTTQLGSHQA